MEVMASPSSNIVSADLLGLSCNFSSVIRLNDPANDRFTLSHIGRTGFRSKSGLLQHGLREIRLAFEGGTSVVWCGQRRLLSSGEEPFSAHGWVGAANLIPYRYHLIDTS
jgi:hypothetical protein